MRRKKKKRDRDKDKDQGSDGGGGSSGGLKVHSVAELAELVKSGAIQEPKSLTHYQNDRAKLLDQVFTILSSEDIKGMLPDILKVDN